MWTLCSSQEPRGDEFWHAATEVARAGRNRGFHAESDSEISVVSWNSRLRFNQRIKFATIVFEFPLIRQFLPDGVGKLVRRCDGNDA